MTTANAGQTIRAMVVLPSATGMPRDDVVNTFHFFGSTIDDATLTTIAARLALFYNDSHDGGPSISSMISTAINRGVPVKVKCYDLGDPITRNAQGKVIVGRPPHETSFVLNASTGSGPLPNEVAVTASFWSGRNSPRTRGRLYLGPLDRSVISSGTGDVRFGTTYRQAVNAAMSALRSADSAGLAWGVWSETGGLLSYPIDGGWTDDAFDTQRRRGVKAAARTSWVSI